MTIKDWSDLAGAIQAFTLALAVIVGGGWALFRFLSLNSIAKARAELEAARRALRERGTLDIRIEHQPTAPSKGKKIWLLCNVFIENSGNGTEAIDWASSRFIAIPIALKTNQAEVLFANAIAGSSCRSSKSKSTIVLPGDKFQEPYLICLPGHGLYKLSFEAQISSTAQEDMEKSISSANITYPCWVAEKIVSI